MQKHVLTVGRFEIPCAVHAEGHDVLVCVNGMQQTMAAWRSLVRRIAAGGRYRVALFDFPNQGRARILGGAEQVPILEQVEVLAAVVQVVSPDRPVALLGGSWGAAVAAAYAALYPGSAAKLVLASFQARANARLRDVARRGQLLIEQGRVAELAAMFVTEFGFGMPPERRRGLETQFLSLRPEQLRQMHQQGAALASADDLGAMVDLGAIRANTLIINGAADPIVDAEDIDGTVARIPGAELRIVPEAGHFLHLERPEVLDIYAEFLHRVSVTSTAV